MIAPKAGDAHRAVTYRRPMCEIEHGEISSWNENYVFVFYGSGAPTAKATRREDLEWGHVYTDGYFLMPLPPMEKLVEKILTILNTDDTP